MSDQPRRRFPGPEHRAILGVLGRNRLLVVAVAAGTLAEAGLLLLIPYLSKQQIEVLEAQPVWFAGLLPPSPVSLLLAAVIAIMVASVLSSILSALSGVLDVHTREKLCVDTERVLYDKLETFDAGFLQNPRNRKLIYVLFDISHLSHMVLSLGLTQARVVVLAAGILPLLLATDLQIFAAVLAAALLQLGVLRLRVRRENDYRLFKERRLGRINEMRFLLRHHFHQLLGIEGQGRVMPRYWAMRAEGVRLEVGEARLQLRYRVAHHVLEHLALLAVALLVGLRVLDGAMSIGAFTMVLMYAHQIMAALSSMHDSVGEWYQARSVFCQLGFYLRLRPRVDLSRSEVPQEAPRGEIRVRDLRFRYPSFSAEEREYLAYLIEVLELSNRKRAIWQVDSELVKDWQRLLEQGAEEHPLVLDGVDCTFRQGELTALVGRNGSGKTTLLNLLMRTHDPEAGEVEVAGAALQRLHPRALRRFVSLVPQQPFLLESFSLRDNLLLGNQDDVEDEAIWQVLRDVGLADDLERLPRRLDTLLGDETSLSGGQGQLLVVARAVLQRRPFLFLDEGTNQLDAEHELRLIRRLDRLKEDATLVVVTHRMTTARRADRIHVLDQGRIVESGTHDELLARQGGLYRKFWEIQVEE